MTSLDKWTEERIANQLEQAVITMHRLPPVNIKGYTNYWPDVVLSRDELARSEPNSIRLPPTPEMIAKMEQALSWMKWLTEDERKLVWLRAERARWKKILRELGYANRVTGLRKWQLALRKIKLQLDIQTAKRQQQLLRQ